MKSCAGHTDFLFVWLQWTVCTSRHRYKASAARDLQSSQNFGGGGPTLFSCLDVWYLFGEYSYSSYIYTSYRYIHLPVYYLHFTHIYACRVRIKTICCFFVCCGLENLHILQLLVCVCLCACSCIYMYTCLPFICLCCCDLNHQPKDAIKNVWLTCRQGFSNGKKRLSDNVLRWKIVWLTNSSDLKK